MLKLLLRTILKLVYHVEVKGLEHYRAAGKRVLIIANHSSFLDAVLLTVFFPGRMSFAINTQIARRRYARLVRPLVDLFVLDPLKPFSLRAMIRYIQQERTVTIFPEGRITMTGSLMKIYHGPGLVADRSGAQVLPVRIEGAQYSMFSRLRGRIKLRWFPKITLTVLAPRQILAPTHIHGRQRRIYAGQVLSDVMTEMMFTTSNYRRSIFTAVLDGMRLHGHKYPIIEDIQRLPLSYVQLLRQCFTLGRFIRRGTAHRDYIGILLPNTNAAVISLLAILSQGRIPVMLNFSSGKNGLVDACKAAALERIYTSRQFVQTTRLEESIAQLQGHAEIIYLEDVVKRVRWKDSLFALLAAAFPSVSYKHMAGTVQPDDAAVVLFTSGTEGPAKGVVLSHSNIMANTAQLAAKIDFNSQDIIFSALPMYHSFGLMAGCLLPLTAGIRTFYYPSPMHYRIIPELVYSTNATIMFGTNTFLKGYAQFAHPYDFYSMRYVFAGGEKITDATRHEWSDKFGLRVLEGYGTTETSPVLCANTPLDLKPGTVGKFLPGIRHKLEAVAGVADGGQLFVKGPNIMLGYLMRDRPGQLQRPQTPLGDGWYDTGDVVSIDREGFVTILGRVKQVLKE